MKENRARVLFKLDKAQKLRILKLLIKPIMFIPLVHNYRPTGLLSFPKQWESDFIKICAEYKNSIIFKVGNSATLEGSYCSFKKLITIIADRTGYISTENLIIIFSHELAHCLQYKFYNTKNKKDMLFYFDDNLEFEREADTLSYHIYKAYFKHKISIHANTFRSYYSKESVEFLRKTFN